jgi:hypothetical protein
MKIMGFHDDRSKTRFMSFIIALLATFVAIYQNSVMLAFGFKEGAIYAAPLVFGLFLAIEFAVIWVAFFILWAFIKRKGLRAALMALVAVGVIGACELVMKDNSAFAWAYRNHEKTAVLKQIKVEATTFEKRPEGGFALTYTLKFPKDGHYLTFPAYLGKPDPSLYGWTTFGKYEDGAHPEYYDENYMFKAGQPYDFTVTFPAAPGNDKQGKAHIQICDSKGYDMSCHTIDISVEGAENAPAEAK